ncbi:winged helix-turn-helix domain-containing protein [Pseudoxanthomonas sp.]|uniref:protein kinase domain-containing protein n=1 Tax=Pseudoxanthomonas sp. TaxID=1871049 RepID=UPI002590A336|nr:winged helix-turn-helix domain-containing protein [Pseudoxanthomonas sp.]MCR6685398.1 winged helix-turn-helix domain-containing protein [Pseudoxanthomonas sp.]
MSAPTSPDPGLYRWRFGAAEFDEARHELRVAGEPVEIEHKPLQVLALLLRHAGEVVTKQELFAVVWSGRATVDHVLATAIGKLRKALGGDGEGRILTVPRIGYRLLGPVERIASGRLAGSPLQLRAGQPVPGRGHFLLERALGRTLGSEVWLARHPRSREPRVFKFALDGERLASLRREATVSRVLRDTLGERDDLVRVLDWNFETAPFFLECGYGGQPLPEWAAEQGRLAAMDRTGRIGVFLEIAAAVAAAHGVGVLHKDLKPSNILMAPRPDGWQPRLADFGSSRLLQPERLAELGITALGLTVTRAGEDSSGTPLYLAPELLAGQSATVRSDIHALGVLLYQWLAGDLRRPLAPGWERDIDDPLLVADIARATDLDPERRFGSVAELADNLVRLPQRRAEQARRTAVMQAAADLRRALERARARRPWIAATVMALSLGLLASGLLWYRSERQRQTAVLQATRAEAVVRFLSDDLIGSLSPGGRGFERDPSVRQLLEQSTAALAGRFDDDPATRGSIHAALGDAWRALGEHERAATHLRQAARDYAQAFGADDSLALKTRYGLVRTLAYAGSADSFAEAARVLETTDASAGALLQGENEVALAAWIARGQFHFQQLQIEPSLQAHRRADVLQRALRPDDAPMAALIRSNLADATLRLGDDAGAAMQLQAILADPLLDPARVGESTVAGYRVMLARALRNLGRYDQALPLARQAAATTERILGVDAYATLIQMSTVASIHDAAGDCTPALAIARTVRERMAARYGEDRQATLVETGNLGLKEYDCGDRTAALDYLRRAESGLRQQYGEDNFAAHSFRYSLADKLAGQGLYHEAREMADGIDLDALSGSAPDGHWDTRVRALRGRILILSGERTAGRELLEAALAELEELGTEDPDDLQGLQALLQSAPAAP